MNKFLTGLFTTAFLVTLTGCGQKHTHEWVLKGNENGHRYVCECGAEGESVGHGYTKEVTQEASKYQKGIYTFTCAQCGYSYESEFDPTEQQVMNETAAEIKALLDASETVSTETAQQAIAQYRTLNAEARALVTNINKAKSILKDENVRAVEEAFAKITTIQESHAEIQACLDKYNLLSDDQKFLVDTEDTIVELKKLDDYYQTIDVTNTATQQEIIRNTAMAYYYQLTQLQYDQRSSRRNNSVSPEDCTAYNYHYLDCSSFANQVYYQVFGESIIPATYPSNVNTSKIDSYGSSNAGADDVVFYRTLKNLPKSEWSDDTADEVRQLLQPGDVYVYRHDGDSSQGVSSGGHAMLYLGKDENGEDFFLHSSGADNDVSGEKMDPYGNFYEGQSEPEKNYGTLAYDTANIVFVEENGWDSKGSYKDRYMFNYLNTSWTFLRPVHRMAKLGATVNPSAVNRLLFPYMNAEKASSIGEYHSATKGSEVTFTITVKNESQKEVMPYAYVSDIIPENAEFVSISDGGVYDGTKLSWSLTSILPGETREVSYTIKATGHVGSQINSKNTYVNGIKLNTIKHEIKADKDVAKLVETLKSKIGSQYNYVASMANEAYTEAWGIDLKLSGVLAYKATDGTYKLGDNTLISYGLSDYWKNDAALFSGLIPNILFGGKSVRSNHSANDNDIRNMDIRFLEPGDLIGVADNDGKNYVYVYVDDQTLLTIDNKIIKDESSKYMMNGQEDLAGFIHSLCFHKQFVVVRPSLCSLYEAD